jgi:hypothetical protein
MESSLKASTVPNFQQGVELRQRTEALRQLLKQNIYGEESPRQVLESLQTLAGASSQAFLPGQGTAVPLTPAPSVPATAAAPSASRKP